MTADPTLSATITLADHEAAVKAAVDAEREACAKVCDDRGADEKKNYGLNQATQNYFRTSAAIRARANGGE